MKGLLQCCVAAIVVLATFGSTATTQQPDPEQHGKHLLGKPAPDFTLKDASGKTWKLSSLKGKKLVVIDFGRTYCVRCRDTVEDLQQIHEAYKGRGVQVFTVCVNAEDLQVVRDFISDKGVSYPVLRDVELKAARTYRLQLIPFTVIVQKSGYVHWVLTDHPDNYAHLVREQLNNLLAKQ